VPVSLAAGSAVYIYFGSIWCGAATVIAGVLIDIDHIFDYILNHGFTFSPKKFYIYCMVCRFKRILLVFHSYELLAVIWAAIFALSLGRLWVAVAIGLTLHLAMDQIRNVNRRKVDPRIYFFTYRLMNGFETRKLLRKKR